MQSMNQKWIEFTIWIHTHLNTKLDIIWIQIYCHIRTQCTIIRTYIKVSCQFWWDVLWKNFIGEEYMNYFYMVIKLIIMEGGIKILEKSVNKVCSWIDAFGLWTIYSATTFLERCRKVVQEIWFKKSGSRNLVREKWLTRKKGGFIP